MHNWLESLNVILELKPVNNSAVKPRDLNICHELAVSDAADWVPRQIRYL